MDNRMEQKKKENILFVIDSLDCAGAEKSLVTLLSLLDYSKYSVDLLLFAHGNILEKLVPNKVNILSPLSYTKYSSLSINEAFLLSIKKANFNMFYSRIKYSIAIRLQRLRNSQKARVYWENVSKVIENNPKQYDIAISYAQGVPTFYVAEKVKAKKKFAWVNVSYRLGGKEKEFQKKYYDQYDKIVAVSDSTKDIFLETFPEYVNKMDVIYDINNPKFIFEMSKIGDSYEDGFNGLRILTIGRLALQKGYDLALETCAILKEKGINFRWYALGKGPLEEEIKDKIVKYDLTENFKLLGVRANPYPYIRDSDIYVQTSRFEGFGLAIAEARMLNIPVVTTNFDAVFNQMKDGKNGLVVDMEPNAISEGIIKLINDVKLKNNIIEYLKTEQKGNIEEIDKFYRLIG
ncbi:glycosyltransferase [Lederbergia wuyishanensis]|uniref:Glycosyltransferase involved in cell wall biosynthesis n=1 Tax=Lederbergia wuyishanensis TaxID=1347903 RepID=A0ABU0D805_9BACI|nr:glycosyltransferase [Lederbergia wuyishanensis]MCJ8009131.1 glycosyltransferase [Lederbergia wuyishanensis]MDQ0344471.1 glycosyltransferase involved in cell wall biosynthesis [Lederbergia wuyishanensis]